MTSKNKELTASLYALGTELLIGGKIDTNCDFIAKHLTQLGIKVRRRYTIGDNLSELIEAFKLGLEDDIIISSGGLGPTIDDITREALSAVTGIGFRYDKKLLKAIEDRFKARDMEMPANNKLQAQAPIEGGYFPNKNGTAPAIYFELPNSNKVAIALPGPPREMIPIMEKDVVSYLKAKFNIAKRQEKCNIRISGLTESQVDVFLRNIFGQENKDIDLTILSDPGLVDIYLTWKGKDKEAKKGLAACYMKVGKELYEKKQYEDSRGNFNKVVDLGIGGQEEKDARAYIAKIDAVTAPPPVSPGGNGRQYEPSYYQPPSSPPSGQNPGGGGDDYETTNI